jgi:hypothetical protein
MPRVRIRPKPALAGLGHLSARLLAAADACDAVGRWSAGGPPSPLAAGGGDRFIQLARAIRAEAFALEEVLIAAGGPPLRIDPNDPQAWVRALEEPEVAR